MPNQINFDNRFFINLLLLAAAVWFVLKIPLTLFTFGLGILFYLILRPVVSIAERYLKKRWLSILIVFTLFLLILGAIFWLVIPQLITQLNRLITQWPDYYQQLSKWTDETTARLDVSTTRFDPQLKGRVQTYVTTLLNEFGNWFLSAFPGTVNFSLAVISRILSFILALLISIYFLYDEKTIKKAVIHTFKMSPKNVDRMHFMVQHVNKTINGYFRGMTFLSFLMFVLSWVFLSIMNIPYAFLVSLWVGLTGYIPYFGPILGMAPAVILAYMQSFALGNWVLLFFVVVQMIQANILAPKVLSRSLNIHPLIVFFALLAGGEVYGMIGMIIAAPAAAILLTSLKVYRDSADQ